jgi:hypothetical protein
VYTTLSSQEPRRDIGYLVHLPKGMLEVGKGSKHQLRIGFGHPGMLCKVFDSNFSSKMTLLMLRGSMFPRRRYEEGCMKVICGQEDLAYIST